jgi:sacsin
MRHYPRFIDLKFASSKHDQNCLQNLDIEKVPVRSLLVDYILPLPAMLSDLNWRYYQPLIATISHIHTSQEHCSTVRVLTQSKIASDRNLTLRKASELFDHEDRVFVSAFRDQNAEKFLHNDVKVFRQLWLKVGLRYRKNGFFDPADYLQCVQAISRRLTTGDTTLLDGQLETDSRVVLSPLTTPGSSIQKFDASAWLAISKERVFNSRAVIDTEPVYRKDWMTKVAIRRQILALSEIVSYKHVAVCWSQTPFTCYTPTNEVFDKMRGNGKPPLGMVWRHLDHLRETAQNLQSQHVQNFLSDLHSTYSYLEDHLEESRACFSLSTSAIWLNINSSEGEYASLDSVQSSWHEVKDLVLSSSCDAGRVKAVRPSLMRYEKLLRALGCNSIIYPTVTRPTIHHGHSVSTSLRKLRDEGKLLDVTYSTEGRLIKAHRVVLAAVSDKCARQFSGRWAVEDPIKYDEQDDPEDYLSYHTLSTMINYAYEDEVDWREMEVSEADDLETRESKLHMLLDLYKGADSWLIPALTSQVEDMILVAGKKFINIENVEEIRQRAEEVRAKEVEKMCMEFIEKNQATVERASSAISP